MPHFVGYAVGDQEVAVVAGELWSHLGYLCYFQYLTNIANALDSVSVGKGVVVVVVDADGVAGGGDVDAVAVFDGKFQEGEALLSVW